jgi:uncharacterized protein YjbI with pentapeptide repeats
MMNFYGRSNRIFVESEIEKGGLHNCQIVECDLSSLKVSRVTWENTELRSLHANDICFMGTHLSKNNITRCSFMRASFLQSKLSGTLFDGLTLIKSKWQDCKIESSYIKNSCLQRSAFYNCRIAASSFIDLEALNVTMDQCVITRSVFTINYGSGMNGWSGAHIQNCIFYNCVFDGYPFRGAEITNCVFVHCSGQIGEDMKCVKVAGLGIHGNAEKMALKERTEAEQLLVKIRKNDNV